MSRRSLCNIFPDLPEDAREAAAKWLEAHRAEIPIYVASALALSLKLPELLIASSNKRQSLVRQLRKALGIIPSSERQRKSGRVLDGIPEDPKKARLSIKERLLAAQARSKELIAWYRKLARMHDRRIKKFEGQIMDLENMELPPEEEALLKEEDDRFNERLELGQRCDLECAKSQEKLMPGAGNMVRTEEIDCMVDRESLPPDAVVKQQFFEERERISFSFTVSRLDIGVEKIAIETKGATKLVTASVEDIGPPKSKITWEFLANMSILVTQYAMPLNRFAGMTSSSAKEFSAGEMSRYFRYVGERLAPIYLQLGQDLKNCEFLMGDDTPSRVIEVTKAFNQAKEMPGMAMPWDSFATPEKAKRFLNESEPTLSAQIASQLGFESERKDGKGAKSRLNTTVLIGRSNLYDPKSQIIFYRSHLGGLGNILDQILAGRNIDNRDLVIQSDLSTTNLISDPQLRARLNITHAGCASHARRPFAIYKDHDPYLCEWILHSFTGLALYEQCLDNTGRNKDNTLMVRKTDELKTWEEIKEAATILKAKWSRETDLGDAARYILRNFDALTYYLNDHRVSPHNNFSERMLRMERLIENNSLFRKTLEGRCTLDITRSILQTAIAAQVDLPLYLNWVLRMPDEVIKLSPSEFTPLAFARLNSQLD